jgi:hypothetical protein
MMDVGDAWHTVCPSLTRREYIPVTPIQVKWNVGTLKKEHIGKCSTIQEQEIVHETNLGYHAASIQIPFSMKRGFHDTAGPRMP